MRKGNAKKLVALIMSALMLIGTAVPAFAASDTGSGVKASTGISLTEIDDKFNLVSYEKYKEKYGYDDNYDKLHTGESVKLDAKDYDKENTDADVQVEEWQGEESVITGESGTISWKVNIPETGFYAVRFRYCAVSEGTTDIERVFSLNGAAPYSEGRYVKFTKSWTFNYLNDEREGAFEMDTAGNELRPHSIIQLKWRNASIHDNDGYYLDELEYYMEKGENLISLTGVRETMAISEVEIYTVEELPSYADVKAEYDEKGYTAADAEPTYMEAEMPDLVSNYTLYPVYDRSSALTSPQSSSATLRNMIGAEKWTSSGQWIQYNFECTASGLYDIVVRYNQSELKGLYTSRSLRINGKYPFKEAKALQFAYDTDWRTTSMTDGTQTFSFYFEEGKTYTIEFEATLGSFADAVRSVSGIIDSLNDDYMSILELTGSDPDENRDYGFIRIMPDVVRDIAIQCNTLYALVDYVSEMNGIKSETTSTLEQAANLLDKMASDEKEIAPNLANLKTWISSLGSWLSDTSTQYLALDYVQIQPAGSDLPRGEAGGWTNFMFEIKKFVASFYTDYDTIGVEGEGNNKVITAWTSSGRDQAQIIKNLTNNGFTRETGVSVTVKLVSAGTLLPSILAGVGPDVSLDSTTPIDMAIRGAVEPLNGFDTYEEVASRFSATALNPLQLYGTTYAIPVGQVVSVMFCRDDILAELNLEAPKTWDDLMSMVPVLQFNNMDIGLASDLRTYMFQMNGEYWSDEGMSTGFDKTGTLDAFETMCNWFTQYSLPVTFDAANRFKTGEMPLIITQYSFYNTLVVFAPEIAGLWSMYEIPGTPDEETGELNHSTVAFTSGILIPRGCRDIESAWDYIDWYSDKDFQVDYSNEMTALLGQSAKQNVANLEAFAELPWSETEYKLLQKVLEDSYSIEEYPGSYYLLRYLTFAFNAAYNDGYDPSDRLLGYVNTINKEISRKRSQFDMMLSEEWSAIKDYTGFETFDQWREYWAELRDTDSETPDCIYDGEDADYTYVDWMKETGVSSDSHSKWQKEYRNGKTSESYKDWLSD